MLENMDWLENAACKGKSDIFFGPIDEKSAKKRIREYIALSICFQCPCINECREYARENNELGIWGAETEEQRHARGFLKDPYLSRNTRARQKRAAQNRLSQLEADDAIAHE